MPIFSYEAVGELPQTEMTPGPIRNAAVAELLQRYAAALAASGVDRFKVKAYRRAAETVERLREDVSDLVKRGGDLRTLPGVGTAISAAIEEIVRSGRLARLDEILARMPLEAVEMATRPQLDSKRVLRIYKKLGIQTLQELADRLASGEIRTAFGERVEMHVRQGLDERPRMLFRKADQIACGIEDFLKGLPGVARVSRTGSLRRGQETVGDLSFLATGAKSQDTLRLFKQQGRPEKLDGEKNRAAVRLASRQLAVLGWTAKNEWGLRLLNETGAAAHLLELENHARRRRVDFTAKGLAARGIDLSEESSVYRALGLPFIEPELREGRGEVAAAAAGRLPILVGLADLKGDLHMHTVASDGGNSMIEMAEAAQARGYEYIAITDHSQSLKLTNGLSEKRLLAQIRQIDRLNDRLNGLVILKSAEVDILEDGSLDYPNPVLRELDLTICSIHSKFRLDRRQQTDRVLKAMSNRYFNILGHATGRLLLSRPGYELDFERIVEYAKRAGCFFEINANPNRLDLSDLNAKLAKDKGVKIAINTDAHSIGELGFMPGGIVQARRAWLEADDVLNTRTWSQLRKLLKR